MTIENFFVKKYEKIEQQNNELEKKVKGLEIDLSSRTRTIEKLLKLIKSGYPKLTAGNFLSISIFISSDEAKPYIDLLEKLNIEIEGDEQE